MIVALKAGLLYSALIFSLGFVLGTLRELWLGPVFGRDAVVLIEGPFILLVSWFAAWWLVRRMPVASRVRDRLAMGATAFGLVMLGEAAVAVFSMGRTLAMHLQTYMTARGMLELSPQVAFALFPLLHLIRTRLGP